MNEINVSSKTLEKLDLSALETCAGDVDITAKMLTTLRLKKLTKIGQVTINDLAVQKLVLDSLISAAGIDIVSKKIEQISMPKFEKFDKYKGASRCFKVDAKSLTKFHLPAFQSDLQNVQIDGDGKCDDVKEKEICLKKPANLETVHLGTWKDEKKADDKQGIKISKNLTIASVPKLSKLQLGNLKEVQGDVEIKIEHKKCKSFMEKLSKVGGTFNLAIENVKELSLPKLSKVAGDIKITSETLQKLDLELLETCEKNVAFDLLLLQELKMPKFASAKTVSVISKSGRTRGKSTAIEMPKLTKFDHVDIDAYYLTTFNFDVDYLINSKKERKLTVFSDKKTDVSLTTDKSIDQLSH